MKVRPRRIIGGLLAVVLMVFCLGWVGILGHEDQHMKGTWTFWASVVVKDDITVEDDLIVTDDSTFTSDVAIGGDLAVTGSIILTDELVLQTYSHGSGDGALSWLTTMGNVFILATGTTATAVALPVGSAALDGYILIAKNISAGTPTFTPAVNSGLPGDFIESTQGTMTGTSDATNDQEGDMKIWVYDYKGSEVSGVWTMLLADQEA